MTWMLPPPEGPLLFAVLLTTALFALVRSGAAFRSAVRTYATPSQCLLWIVRALRRLVIGLTAAAFAAGVWFDQGWLFAVGLVILLQEMYEMTLLRLIIRQKDPLPPQHADPIQGT